MAGRSFFLTSNYDAKVYLNFEWASPCKVWKRHGVTRNTHSINFVFLVAR